MNMASPFDYLVSRWLSSLTVDACKQTNNLFCYVFDLLILENKLLSILW